MILRRILQGVAVLLVIAVAVGWLSGWFESKIPGDGAVPGVAQVIAESDTVAVESVVEPAFEWASGTVRSARRTTVAARILARIEEVRVTAGEDVAAGDLLVILDARDLRARAAGAREALKAAEAQRDLAQSELERADALLKRGVGTRQRYDQALSALQVSEAEVDRLLQGVREAETALSYTEIRVPAAGRVIDRLAEPGDTVSPGQPLLRLYDPTALRVEVPVRESLAVRLRVDDELRIEVPALAETLTGPIDEFVPFAEPGARTLLVKVRMPSDDRLFSGLYARVAVPAGERSRLLVPAEAVTRIGQLEFVTVIEESGPARRMVTSGQRMADGRVDILSGLAAGERVAKSGR